MTLSKAGSRLFVSLAALLAYFHSQPAFASSFQVKLDNNIQALELLSAFVMPGQALPVSAISDKEADKFNLVAGAGSADVVSPREWIWHAPTQPGVYSLEMHHATNGETVKINAFVMYPYTAMQAGKINGYRIGEYPAGRDGAYAQPRGFIEVTKENETTRVSPHFQLKQFICKQDGSYPKYIVLSERLIAKLEVLLTAVNAKGIKAETFHVMSGYRTPAYNRGLGNVKLSRHQYGDAADIYVEDSRTGQMADLNGDGRVDSKDAVVLYSVVQELTMQRPDIFPIGGAGTYESTRAHGPFMHVDARGFNARWGTIVERTASSRPHAIPVRARVKHRRARRAKRVVAQRDSQESAS